MYLCLYAHVSAGAGGLQKQRVGSLGTVVTDMSHPLWVLEIKFSYFERAVGAFNH